MSSLTTDTISRAHRVQILAEAVTSAYINEISTPRRSRQRARDRHGCEESSPRAVARSPLADRALRRSLGPRRPTRRPLQSATPAPSAAAA